MRLETKESKSVKDKPTAMSSLFGDVYITSVQEQRSEQDICKTEVSQYKKRPSINATENPLNWWHQNYERYPISLPSIAKKLLTPRGHPVKGLTYLQAGGQRKYWALGRNPTSPEHLWSAFLPKRRSWQGQETKGRGQEKSLAFSAVSVK